MGVNTAGLTGLLPDRLLIWHDEFDGDSLDLTKWAFAHGYARNGEIHCNDEEHCTLNNSICTITAEPNLVDGVLTPFTIEGDTKHTFKWRCSEFSSKYKFSGNFYIEAKLRLIPDTTNPSIKTRKGFCPAWWAMGDYNTYEWPFNGEIDWMESPSYSGINSTTHYGDPTGSHKAGWMSGGYPNNIDWSTFHTLGWERKDNEIWYYFDGAVTSHKTATEADKALFFGGVNPFVDFPIGTIANIAVGGTASTSATDAERGTNPCAMEIDWVRVYTNEGVTSCAKPSNLALEKGFNFDVGNNTWNPATKTITMRSMDTINFVYSHNTPFAPIKIETSTDDESIAFPCATSGSKVYPQSMGVFSGKPGTTYFNYNESYVDSDDSNKNYTFADKIKIVVSNPEYTKIDTLLENLDFSNANPDWFMPGQLTGYSSQIKLNYLDSSGEIYTAMKHMIVSRPIRITPGKQYTIKCPRWKSKGAMLFTSGDINLGVTKFSDIRPLEATWTQTTSTADGKTYVKNESYESITFTPPSDAKYVVFWGGDVDSNNRRWPFTHVIRDMRESFSIECDRQEIACTGITLSSEELTFTSTSSKTLTATLTPTNTTDTVVWSINNNLATVNNGTITPVGGDGEAIVTAKCGSKTATCRCVFAISGAGGGGGDVVDSDEIILDRDTTSLPEDVVLTNAVLEENATYGHVIRCTSNTGSVKMPNTYGEQELEISFYMSENSSSTATPDLLAVLNIDNSAYANYGVMATKDTKVGKFWDALGTSEKLDTEFDFSQLHTLKLVSDGAKYSVTIDGTIELTDRKGATNYTKGFNGVQMRSGVVLTSIRFKK